MRSTSSKRVLGPLTALAAALAGLPAGLAQQPEGDAVPDLGVAEYAGDGALTFPEDADRWIALGAGIGTNYSDEPMDPRDPLPIGVVQIEPAAYDYFLEHGRYADGTMLLLTFYAPQQNPEPALRGFVQGEPLQKEIHVIDRTRFAEEGRAFFVFGGSEPEPAQPQPAGSECVQCHTRHGRLDGTFTQFYPPLREGVSE